MIALVRVTESLLREETSGFQFTSENLFHEFTEINWQNEKGYTGCPQANGTLLALATIQRASFHVPFNKNGYPPEHPILLTPSILSKNSSTVGNISDDRSLKRTKFPEDGQQHAREQVMDRSSPERGGVSQQRRYPTASPSVTRNAKRHNLHSRQPTSDASD
jgi:hypothetical protein